jgi:uncharacterized protein (DUF488 family)
VDATERAPDERPKHCHPILTIGHSNHSIHHFLGLLRRHGVDIVVDVRSQPYSRFASQFNRELIEPTVVGAGFSYVFLGEELGGRQLGRITSRDERIALADEVAKLPGFERGLRRVLDGAVRYRIALLCAEEDPTECHRRLWVARALQKRGSTVEHIRGDGRIDADDALKRFDPPAGRQLGLFEGSAP